MFWVFFTRIPSLSVYPSVYLSVYLNVCLHISIYLSICISVYLYLSFGFWVYSPLLSNAVEWSMCPRSGWGDYSCLGRTLGCLFLSHCWFWIFVGGIFFYTFSFTGFTGFGGGWAHHFICWMVCWYWNTTVHCYTHIISGGTMPDCYNPCWKRCKAPRTKLNFPLTCVSVGIPTATFILSLSEWHLYFCSNVSDISYRLDYPVYVCSCYL